MNHLMNLIHLNNTRKLLGQTCHKIEALSIPQLDCWQVSPLNVFIRWDIFSSGLRPNIVPVTSTCMKQDTDQLRPVRKSRHPRYIYLNTDSIRYIPNFSVIRKLHKHTGELSYFRTSAGENPLKLILSNSLDCFRCNI